MPVSKAVVAAQGGVGHAEKSNVASDVKDLPVEGAKTTLSNPVFQSAVDDVSDIEEL